MTAPAFGASGPIQKSIGAALLPCDALGWAAAEAATLLDGSTASINPTAANDQPPFAVYEHADGRWAAHSIRVLTLEGGMISALTPVRAAHRPADVCGVRAVAHPAG